MITPAEFARALESWYLEQNNSYPWRETNDPYQILVALIMLQQAPAKKVESKYYPKFLEKFPNLESLANAKWTDIFKLWHGLGAYSKGKNLLRITKQLHDKFHGKFPDTEKELTQIKGLSPIMAQAIMVFAYEHPRALIDQNGKQLIQTLYPEADVLHKAHELVLGAKKPSRWNNALRDLCLTLKAGQEITGELGTLISPELKAEFLPPAPQAKEPKKKKTKKSRRKFRIEVGAACIYRDGHYLVQTRPMGKSFVGQWEFPGGKREKGETIEQCITREIVEELGIEIRITEHVCDILQEFERTELLLRFYICELISGDPVGREGQELRWIEPRKFGGLPFLNTNAECIEKLQQRHL